MRMVPQSEYRNRSRLLTKLSSAWKRPNPTSNNPNDGNEPGVHQDPVENSNSPAMTVSGPEGYNELWTQAEMMLSRGTEKERAHAKRLKNLVPSSNGALIINGETFLKQLQVLVIEKQREAAAKALRVTVGSKTYFVRELTDKIIVWLNRFKEVGDIAVNFDPAHAALPWAAFRFILQAIIINNENSRQLLAGLERITNLCLRCRIYHELYLSKRRPAVGDDDLNRLKASAISLFREILLFLSVSVEFCGTGAFEKVAKGFFQLEKFSTRLASLEGEAAKVEMAAKDCYELSVISGLENVTGEFRKVDDILVTVGTSMNEQEYIEMLRWISDIPYQSDYENAKATRLEGTCNWLLNHDQYTQWRDSRCSTTLWLHGIPGSGKTRLASKVIDDIYVALETTPNDEAFAYFFCDRNRLDHQDPGSILRSLVRQLSSPSGAGRSKLNIVDCTKQDYHDKKYKGFASSQFTIEECQALLKSIGKEYSHITIVIDGLDECDQKSRHFLIETLDDIIATSPGLVKVFIASRDDDDIKDKYKNGKNLMIRTSDNQSDIDKYVAFRIDKTRWCKARMSPKMRQEVIETFRKKSQGMFQWAVLHIGSLLELGCEHLVHEHLHGLPEGLKASYDEIYHSIDKRVRHMADRAFKWIMCSWVPLSPSELVIAVLQNPDSPFQPKIDADIDMVLKICKNLVIVEKSGSYEICRFAHLSVHEYLESHHFTPIQANELVLNVHLRYLLDLEQRVRPIYGVKHDIWDGRMMYWYHQTQAFNGDIPEAALNLMMRFIGTPSEGSHAYKTWLESLRIVEQMEDLKGLSVREDVYEAAFSAIPWVGCIVFELYDVLLQWLSSGSVLPQEMVFNDESALSYTRLHKKPLVWNALVEFGVGINARIGYKTPLIDVATKGDMNLEKARALLQHGANPDLTYVDELFAGSNETALHKACQYGGIKMVALLLEYGADVNINASRVGTPLQLAALNQQHEICTELIKAGADVNSFYRWRRTPLISSLKTGDLELSRLLISTGANVNAMTSDGDTAIHEAIACASKKAIELLIKQKADVNIYSTRHGSPLYYAMKKRQNEDICLMLRSLGADLNKAFGEYDDAVAVAALQDMDCRRTLSSLPLKQLQRYEDNNPSRRVKRREDAIYRDDSTECYPEHRPFVRGSNLRGATKTCGTV